MFTGIVETTSSIRETRKEKDVLAVHIVRPKKWGLLVGQSVSIDGICSTVMRVQKHSFQVQYMPETLKKTTASGFRKKSVVNLERSLRLDSFVDGHLTQGHVDSRVRVARFEKFALSAELTIDVPAALKRYIAPVGSVAINGVSLTVAKVQRGKLTVALIPFTLARTNLGRLKAGDLVNLEIDLLARYVEARLQRK